jgi:ABC-type transporter Mla subunit MlaD
MLTNTDARLQTLATNLNDALQGLDRTLENLANITSNLHAQVDANTNLVSSVSRLLIDADTFVQGLKRHWLLRSAFKEQRATPAADDPQFRRTQSPKALER